MAKFIFKKVYLLWYLRDNGRADLVDIFTTKAKAEAHRDTIEPDPVCRAHYYSIKGRRVK